MLIPQHQITRIIQSMPDRASPNLPLSGDTFDTVAHWSM